jgi:hypothetical protein
MGEEVSGQANVNGNVKGNGGKVEGNGGTGGMWCVGCSRGRWWRTVGSGRLERYRMREVVVVGERIQFLCGVIVALFVGVGACASGQSVGEDEKRVSSGDEKRWLFGEMRAVSDGSGLNLGQLGRSRQRSEHGRTEWPVGGENGGEVQLVVEAFSQSSGLAFVVASPGGTNCLRRWRPRDRAAYLFYRAGSVEPYAYTGELGVCAKERQVPAGYPARESLKCGVSEDARVKVHGYAWPGEVGGETSAEAMSVRRAEGVRRRLGSMGLPDDIVRLEAHGARLSRLERPLSEYVVGVYVEVLSEESEERPVPRWIQSSGPGLSKKMGARFQEALGPMEQRRGTASGVSAPVPEEAYIQIEHRLGRDTMTTLRREMTHEAFEKNEWVDWARRVTSEGCELKGSSVPFDGE